MGQDEQPRPRPQPPDHGERGRELEGRIPRHAPSDQQRRKAILRLLGAGGILAIGATLALAMVGGDGRAGFQSMLVFLGFGSIVAALTGLAGVIADQVRRRPISLRRGLMILAGFFASLLCLIMLAALAPDGRLPA